MATDGRAYGHPRAGDRTGIDGTGLGSASRFLAKVDSAAVRDEFELYLHGFIVTADGHCTVVQQGIRLTALTVWPTEIPAFTPKGTVWYRFQAKQNTNGIHLFEERLRSGLPIPLPLDGFHETSIRL